ncbi:MAG: BlaI/MecI/CopY family transcriptional regulator [Duncaniella sp.]|nr:BlaI/MecI/CopY family transcriptional regulator [Duncaniella sp.]
MKSGRPRQHLTEKESTLMQMLWQHGPLFVRDMLELYPEPKPHFNTIATTVRILEDKGYVTHEAVGASHRFRAIAAKEDFSRRGFAELIRDYFDNSYKKAVSALVEEEKITPEELREILTIIENKKKS